MNGPVEAAEQEALRQIAAATSTDELKAAEQASLGKKGELAKLMGLLGGMSAEERPAFGQAVNGARNRVTEALNEKAAQIKAREQQARFADEAIDITMPARHRRRGRVHVLQHSMDRIKQVLGSMGFVYAESPELEDFRYNFDALNYPPDHPAMDEQDTFYVTDDLVLRTQCTALQGRIFETTKPPLRFFTVGRTFRNEAVDRTHGHTFHQVDCFMIDRGVSLAHLKGTLGVFARELIGPDVTVRFRPDFFPFVEPGVDYAISTPKLFNGRWLELGGAGMIHPNILERYGIDPDEFSGFAFGLGVERIPMMAYGIDDLRLFWENDLRFLEQFS